MIKLFQKLRELEAKKFHTPGEQYSFAKCLEQDVPKLLHVIDFYQAEISRFMHDGFIAAYCKDCCHDEWAKRTIKKAREIAGDE